MSYDAVVYRSTRGRIGVGAYCAFLIGSCGSVISAALALRFDNQAAHPELMVPILLGFVAGFLCGYRVAVSFPSDQKLIVRNPFRRYELSIPEIAQVEPTKWIGAANTVGVRRHGSDRFERVLALEPVDLPAFVEQLELRGWRKGA
jgi:hypothetical protein